MLCILFVCLFLQGESSSRLGADNAIKNKGFIAFDPIRALDDTNVYKQIKSLF